MKERGLGTGALVGIVIVIVVVAVVVPATAVVILGRGGTTGGGSGTMKLSSSAFSDGGAIPITYTADGANYSPPLTISGVSSGAVTLALIVDDLDVTGGYTHWIIWNIPASTTSIPDGVAAMSSTVSDLGDAKQGINGDGNPGYTGPAPPQGTHRYQFTLYALDTSLDLAASADESVLVQAMSGHVIDQATLTGTYSK